MFPLSHPPATAATRALHVPPQPSAGDGSNHSRDDDSENNHRRNEYLSPVEDQEFVPPDDWSDDAYRDGGFGGIPASAAAIAGLQKQMYINSTGRPAARSKRRRRGTGGEAVTGAPPCAICLDGFECGDVLSVMPCSHWFHKACLAKWLVLSRLCPCCRHALPGEGEIQPAVRHDAAAAPSSTTATAESAAAANDHEGFEGSSRARQAARTRRTNRTRQTNVSRGMNAAAPTTATIEGGVTSAAANQGGDEGGGSTAATQAAARRSNRARQANVRLS